jgi:hypothetical protein
MSQSPPPEALQRLSQALSDAPALQRLRLSLSDGQLIGDDGTQRAPLPPLDPPLLDALRRWQATAPTPLHEVTIDSLRLRLLSAPLLADASPQLWVERARRPRVPLDVLVNQGWLHGDEALILSRTLQHGGNVLITALRPSDALTLLDALLDLPDPTQSDAFFIGDTRALSYDDLPITCLDRAALKALDPAARLSLEPWLLEARWVFYDQLASSDDVRLWSGGGSLAKGRVGVLTADGPQEAIHRLHALVFPQAQLPRTHVPGLIDLLIFIDRRQTGAPQALLWQVDLATGYLIAIEDTAAQDGDWQPAPGEEVSLDPAADLPPPATEEVSSNLAQAMAGAFAGLGDDLFSDDAPPAPTPAPAAPTPAPAAPAPAPAAQLAEMDLSFGDDELEAMGAPATTSSSGDFSFDEAELDAAAAAASAADRAKAATAPLAGNRRHPPPQAAAASASSRYNPDAIRQDAERLRAAAATRYRPPTDAAGAGAPPTRRPSSASVPALPTSAAPPGAAPPSAARTPSARPTAPSFERAADGSRSGSWRKPPSGSQVPGARAPITRPPTNPSNMMRRPSNPAVEELPILPSSDLEALSDASDDGDSFSIGTRQHQETAIFRESNDPTHREGTLPPDAGAYGHSPTRLFDPAKPPPLSIPLPPPPRPAEPKGGSGLLRNPASPSAGDDGEQK